MPSPNSLTWKIIQVVDLLDELDRVRELLEIIDDQLALPEEEISMSRIRLLVSLYQDLSTPKLTQQRSLLKELKDCLQSAA